MNKRKMIVLAVVGLLLVGAVLVLMPNANAQSNISGNMAVYIQPYGESAERESASVDIGDPDGVEQFLMSFGGSIRTTTFTPNFTQNVGGIFKEARYEVWALAQIKLTGIAIKTVTKSLVALYGQVYTSGAYKYNVGTAGQAQSLAEANKLVLESVSVFEFSHLSAEANPPNGGKFSMKQDVNTKAWTELKGADIDKLVLDLWITAEGNGPGGIVTKLDRHITCQITVTSWTQCILQLSIIGFSMASNVLSIALPMEMAAQSRFAAS